MNFRSPFFHYAPVGQMFTIIRDALMRIENGTQDPETSWRQMPAEVGKLR